MKRRVGVCVGGKGRNELGVFLTPLILSLSLSHLMYRKRTTGTIIIEIPKGESTMEFYYWI